MYDLHYMQDRACPPQRADLPVLRGPYRRTSTRNQARLVAGAVQTIGLCLFILGISAIGSEDLTACFIAAAVTAAGAGITALGARMGDKAHD